jgi:PKHD-type hydroxylase|tara:strand:+ start:1352 stop:1978 length:627 start_codon:yes stop_codon:yes gene_type:complete
MNLKYYYWYFQSVIPERICDEIIQYGLKQENQMAITGHSNEQPQELTADQLKNIQKKRKSDIVWMSDPWIYREIQPFIHRANANSGWNFEWDYSEACQFTEYKKGQFYDWHCDSYEEPYNIPDDLDRHGKYRKLSMTVSLSDPNTYEGGDLEFDFRNTDEGCQPRICEEIRAKGSVVVFPSFVWHRVKPVTKGIRHSLVCWNLGYPFK